MEYNEKHHVVQSTPPVSPRHHNNNTAYDDDLISISSRNSKSRSSEILFRSKREQDIFLEKMEIIEKEVQRHKNKCLDEIPYNLGALASSDAGFMYPEELSVFGVKAKDQLRHFRESCSGHCYVSISWISVDLGEFKHGSFVVLCEIDWDVRIRHCTKKEIWRSTEAKKIRYPFWNLDDENMGVKLEVSGQRLLSFEIFSRDTLGSEEFLARVDIFPYLIHYYQQESGKDNVSLRCDVPVTHMIQDLHLKKWQPKKNFRGSILLKLGYHTQHYEPLDIIRTTTSRDTPLSIGKTKSKRNRRTAEKPPFEKIDFKITEIDSPIKLTISKEMTSGVFSHIRRKTDNSVIKDYTLKKRFSQPKYGVREKSEKHEKMEEPPQFLEVSDYVDGVAYNLGAFFSDGAGWIYPENLSVFTKESKDQIMAIKQEANNYSITIHVIEGRDIFSPTTIDGKGNPVVIVYTVCCDQLTKFSIKQEVWKSEILKRTTNPYWNLDDDQLGVTLKVEGIPINF